MSPRDTTDNPKGTTMTAYTITLADSKRGRYHISSYDPPLVLHDPDQGDPYHGGGWTTFEPLCKAVATQRDTIWSNPDKASIMEVWQAFVQALHQSLTCNKCERAAWPLLKQDQQDREEATA